MTTKYEEVHLEATKQVSHTRTELTIDLKNSNRLIPPPFNIVVLLIGIVVDFFNFIVVLIYPRFNIYRLISAQLFVNLQNLGSEEAWQPIKGSESLFNTRADLLRWYFVAPFYRFRFLQKWFCCGRSYLCKLNCCGKQRTFCEDRLWKRYHKTCYGV